VGGPKNRNVQTKITHKPKYTVPSYPSSLFTLDQVWLLGGTGRDRGGDEWNVKNSFGQSSN
jgi:hypothetical protein